MLFPFAVFRSARFPGNPGWHHVPWHFIRPELEGAGEGCL